MNILPISRRRLPFLLILLVISGILQAQQLDASNRRLFLKRYQSLKPETPGAITDIQLSQSEVQQGQSLKIKISTSKVLKTGKISVFGQTQPLTELPEPSMDGNETPEYGGFIGIPYNQKPGRYAINVQLQFPDGSVFLRQVTVEVRSMEFPKESIRISKFKNKKLPAPLMKHLEDENRLFAQLLQRVTPAKFFSEPFIQPIEGRITSRFGASRLYNGADERVHRGVDIANQAGTPVKAANTGRVILAKPLVYHGNTVVIDHGMGVVSIYNHLQKIDVQENTDVTRGDIVGKVGSTGVVTGPHLHWSLSVQDTRVDPMYWVYQSDLAQ